MLFLSLCFFCSSNVEEDLKKIKQAIEDLQNEKSNLTTRYSLESTKINEVFKNIKTQMDHITKENTELRKDIRALNQDMHTLQNKPTSKLIKTTLISLTIASFVVAFVFFRFYYQLFHDGYKKDDTIQENTYI